MDDKHVQPLESPDGKPFETGAPGSKQRVAVYVISLARARERRESIAKHLRSLGIEFEIVDGVDGRTLSQDSLAAVTAPGCSLTAGMIACGLSHLEVSKRHLAGDRDVALFLEDDARLSPATVAFIRDGVDASKFDFCFLDCEERNWQGPVYYDPDDSFEITGGFRAHRLSAGPLKAHAFMITKAATAQRIEYMVPVRHCIDNYQSLPYSPRFYLILAPKAAWLSDLSFQSFTTPSGTSGDVAPTRFAAFRQSAFYHRLRDWLKLKQPRRMLLARLLKAEGVLDAGKRWRPLSGYGQVLR